VRAAIIGGMIWGDGGAILLGIIGFAGLLAVARPKATKVNEYDASLKKYFPD
jgi:hypothetical protein